MVKRRARKLYILDTNVFLHDPNCLFKFEENDIFVPFVTLEELDNKKVGTADVNRNARQATRFIDEVVSQPGEVLANGYPLKSFNGKKATGRLFLQSTQLAFLEHEHVLKNDNLYLAVLNDLRRKHPKTEVVLVSKDINLRIKGKGMGFKTEDYKNDQIIEDADLLYRGWEEVNRNFLAEAGDALESWQAEGRSHYRLPQKKKRRVCNEMLIIDGYSYLVTASTESTLELQQADDFTKTAVFGINARNSEQNQALNLLLNPNVDFVALLGPAGTGKTLLTLAAALEQVMEQKKFSEIIFTRATVPLGDDIGFLPGSEEEKMLPWMGALQDNLEVLMGGRQRSGKDGKLTDRDREINEIIMDQYVKVKAMTFMRGRTFNEKFLIIDEAQNLTAKQMKSLITRAGPGTKVVCMGNLAQIDTPYLSEANSGLAYAAESFKGWAHYGQVILSQGERSRLASYANDHMT